VKTQLLRLGGFVNQAVPIQYQPYIVDKLKLYGILITTHGLNDGENWEKSKISIEKLVKKIPPFGTSPFGKIHFVYIYYLCMFNYLSQIITPPSDLLRKAEKAIVNFLWYPCKIDIIKRGVLKLPPDLGGIGLPDFQFRLAASRLCFFARVLSSKEELSWRRSFFHFYRRVEFMSKIQISRLGENYTHVPTFYREIRLSVLQSRFRRDGDFCWIFGEKTSLKNLTPKYIYSKFIKTKFGPLMADRNLFWAQHLGVDVKYVEMSWRWSKASFTYGLARDTHFKVRHKSLYTKHKSSHITGGDNFCTFCAENGNFIKEDNVHLFLHCPRATEIYQRLSPVLLKISGSNTIDICDFVLGKKIAIKIKQTCFNFLVQNIQLAIWQSRKNGENLTGEQNTFKILKTNLFRNLYRVKTVTPSSKFFEIFGDITFTNDSVVGFSLSL
jgi:hypothetical protein